MSAYTGECIQRGFLSTIREILQIRPENGKALAEAVLMPWTGPEASWWLHKYHQGSILPYLVSGQQCRQILLLYQAMIVWQPSLQCSRTCPHPICHLLCKAQNLGPFLCYSWLQWDSPQLHLCLLPAIQSCFNDWFYEMKTFTFEQLCRFTKLQDFIQQRLL